MKFPSFYFIYFFYLFVFLMSMIGTTSGIFPQSSVAAVPCDPAQQKKIVCLRQCHVSANPNIIKRRDTSATTTTYSHL